MDPRARVVAFVIAVVVAAGAGYAIGAATDGEPAPVETDVQAPNRTRPADPLKPEPDSSGAAAEEYELTP